MLTAAAAAIVIAALALTETGLQLLLFPVIFVYPTRFLYEALPYNIGVDDLLIGVTAVVMLLKNRFRLGPVWPKRIYLYLTFLAMAEFVSIIFLDETSPGNIKASLKYLVFFVFYLIMSSTLRNKEARRPMLISFLVSMALASLTVLGSKLGLYWAEWFYVLREDVVLEETRHFGSFGGPWNVGLCASGVVILAFSFMFYSKDKLLRVVSLVTFIMMNVALLLAGSRLGIMGVAAVYSLVMLFSSKRKYALVALALTVPLFLNLPFFTEQVGAILERTTSQMSGSTLTVFEGSGRVDTIMTSASRSFGWWSAFTGFGRGYMTMYPHNSFLFLAFAYGVPCLLVFLYLNVRLAVDSWRLARGLGGEFEKAFATGVLLALAGWTVNSFFADLPAVHFWNFMFLYFVAMIEVSCEDAGKAQENGAEG